MVGKVTNGTSGRIWTSLATRPSRSTCKRQPNAMPRESRDLQTKRGTKDVCAAKAGLCSVTQQVLPIPSRAKESTTHCARRNFLPRLFLRAVRRNMRNAGVKILVGNCGARHKCDDVFMET